MSAGGGIRTLTGLCIPLDFESSASANFATPARWESMSQWGDAFPALNRFTSCVAKPESLHDLTHFLVLIRNQVHAALYQC